MGFAAAAPRGGPEARKVLYKYDKSRIDKKNCNIFNNISSYKMEKIIGI